VQGAFEKDDKKSKQTARKMIAMMLTINQENFDGNREVTCYSCHRGSTAPVGTPVVMADEVKPGMRQVKPEEGVEVGGPAADQLIDKYLKAVGGAAAIEKVTSRVMKGTITFGDRNVPIEIFAKDPDKRVSFTHTPDGDSVTAFDGHEGWLGVPGRPVREMHGPDIDAAAMDADLHFPAHLKTMFREVKVQGTEKVEWERRLSGGGPARGKNAAETLFR
jgi:photosynthetic reaction center cytochrome c subunit